MYTRFGGIIGEWWRGKKRLFKMQISSSKSISTPIVVHEMK
jgi:hypothetical protein